MVEENIWENPDTLSKCFDEIKTMICGEGWTWVKNTQCKYIDIRIDMRDGEYILKDRGGNRVSLERIKWQKEA